MTQNSFFEKTATLEDFYNKKLNPTQMKIWFEELKNYDEVRYEKSIRFLCKSSQYMPTLSGILEAMKRGNIYSEQQREGTECKACKGTGYIIYHKKISNKDYEYACLCNCANAQGLEYDGTKIADKEHKTSYYIERAEKIFN